MLQSVISSEITLCVVLVLCYTVFVPYTRYQVPGTVVHCTNNREDGSESWTFGRIGSFGDILDSASLRPICHQISLSVQKSTLCPVLSIIKLWEPFEMPQWHLATKYWQFFIMFFFKFVSFEPNFQFVQFH